MGNEAAPLDQMFRQGYRVDIDKTFENVSVIATHQEIPYRFRKCAPPIETYPLFSICHPTARVGAAAKAQAFSQSWQSAYLTAMQNADHPETVEYILCVDSPNAENDAEDVRRELAAIPPEKCPRPGKLAVIANPLPPNHGCVGPNNIAAAGATGAIYINGQDDVFFPEHWDTQLLAVAAFHKKNPAVNPFFIHVSSGSPSDDKLFAPQIYSAARYREQGYAFPPEYESMYADNDLTERAYHDGIVLEARHLLFEQRHPAFKKALWDSTYLIENAQERYTKGREILERRRKELGFSEADIPAPRREIKHIAFGLPGETFHRFWVANWTIIAGTFIKNYDVTPCFEYSTNVYVTRHEILQRIKEAHARKPVDAVVWIDDDNTPTAEQIALLLAQLEANPQLDGVAGWCYCAFYPPQISCGLFSDRGYLQHYTQEMFDAAPGDLLPIDWTGFPIFVTRMDVYDKLGPHPFAAIHSEYFPYLQSGEDTSFCIRARTGVTHVLENGVERQIQGKGLLFAVDRRVKVPHNKIGSLNRPVKAPTPPPATSGETGECAESRTGAVVEQGAP